MDTQIIPHGKSLILYDGNCALCQGSVQWILKRDQKEKFVFASLQGRIGQEVMRALGSGIDTQTLKSFILIEDHQIFRKSTAAWKSARKLGFPYSLLSIIRLIPKFLRDTVYDWVAANRYRWFGEKCWIPQEKWKSRFLDE